eukprot:14063568-Alexandrium_andersonii.AAC.1
MPTPLSEEARKICRDLPSPGLPRGMWTWPRKRAWELRSLPEVSYPERESLREVLRASTSTWA